MAQFIIAVLGAFSLLWDKTSKNLLWPEKMWFRGLFSKLGDLLYFSSSPGVHRGMVGHMRPVRISVYPGFIKSENEVCMFFTVHQWRKTLARF